MRGARSSTGSTRFLGPHLPCNRLRLSLRPSLLFWHGTTKWMPTRNSNFTLIVQRSRSRKVSLPLRPYQPGSMNSQRQPSSTRRGMPPYASQRRASDLEWFEERFLELKTMVSRREVRHERDRFHQRQACRDHQPRRSAFRGLAWRENHGGRGNAARRTFTLA